MTTLVESIQAALNPLAAGGSWYGVCTAQPPVLPYIVFRRIPSATNNNFSGPSDLQNTRVQVDLYAASVSGLVALGVAVEAAMAAAAFSNVRLSSQDLYEPDTKLHRTSIDFSVWSTN